MIKKILIVSLTFIALGTAEFRFGGVSSQTGRQDLADFSPKHMKTIFTKLFLPKLTPIWFLYNFFVNDLAAIRQGHFFAVKQSNGKLAIRETRFAKKLPKNATRIDQIFIPNQRQSGLTDYDHDEVFFCCETID
jgi:hypothetical protein